MFILHESIVSKITRTMKQILCTLAILSIIACEKKTVEPDADKVAPLTIEYDNIVGNMNLQLNTGVYRTSIGESFSVNQLQYYISNVAVQKADGNWHGANETANYHLIKEGDESRRHVRLNVPEGDYVALKFIVGVDSLRSTMGPESRTGVLDPADEIGADMYWGWNSGYVFFKLEGTSPDIPVDPTGNSHFRFHIGGFGGYNTTTINNIKEIYIDLKTAGIAKVRTGRIANIHLMADVLKVFNGTNAISLKDNPTVMFSTFSQQVANNYQHMFTHDHTEN